jgi:pyruvate ferredoxin oxidoreductase gamma subunit
MREIRMHGRFGQPVGKLAAAVAKHAMEQGKHVQVFNSFAAFRPGGPTFALVRLDDGPIRRRSANATTADIVIVLDNSLYGATDVTKGLRAGGTVMALGVEAGVLGDKAGDFAFVALDSHIKGRTMTDIEQGVISGLRSLEAF